MADNDRTLGLNIDVEAETAGAEEAKASLDDVKSKATEVTDAEARAAESNKAALERVRAMNKEVAAEKKRAVEEVAEAEKKAGDEVKKKIEEVAAAEEKAAEERIAANKKVEDEALKGMAKRQEEGKKALAQEEADVLAADKRMQKMAAKAAAGAAAVAGAGMQLQRMAGDLREIDPAAAEAMESIGKVTEKAGTLATTIAAGFSMGGPYGAIAGTVVGLGKILIDEYESTNREILQLQQDNADLAERVARGAAQIQKEILAEQSAELKKAADRDDKIMDESRAKMERFVKQRKEQLDAMDKAADAASKARLAELKAAGGNNQAEAEQRVDDVIRKFNKGSEEDSLELHALRGDYEQKNSVAQTMQMTQVEPARTEFLNAQNSGNPLMEKVAARKLENVEKLAREAEESAEQALQTIQDTQVHINEMTKARVAELQAEVDRINADLGTAIQLPLERAAETAGQTVEQAASGLEEMTRGAADAVQPAGQAVADAGQQLAGDLQQMATSIQTAATAVPTATVQASYAKLQAATTQAHDKIAAMFNDLTKTNERLLTRLETQERAIQQLQSRL